MTMDNRTTYEQIIALIAEKLSIDQERITNKSTLQELGVDSLDMVEIIIQLEDMFGIQIDDDKAAQLHTLDDIVAYVDQLRAHKK